MQTYILKIIMLIMLYCTSNVYAQETLTIMTEDGPPHMIQASDSGIDLDITSEVLESLGYNTRMLYAPLTRAKFQVTQGLGRPAQYLVWND